MGRNEIGTAKEILNSLQSKRKKRAKTSLNLDPDVWAEFKMAVKQRDLFLSEVLEELLTRFCKGA